ncbi:hypothetical protein [Bradyrhizobium guangzhouense]|uniref:hypothetical protein n=1 Tax=Bradyrhizobium guangzhouense TaxID=1325095 RepID=UPI0013E8A45F|nr:hypothetical protein [Bradyrhizobium guangzhouense]
MSKVFRMLERHRLAVDMKMAFFNRWVPDYPDKIRRISTARPAESSAIAISIRI